MTVASSLFKFHTLFFFFFFFRGNLLQSQGISSLCGTDILFLPIKGKKCIKCSNNYMYMGGGGVGGWYEDNLWGAAIHGSSIIYL